MVQTRSMMKGKSHRVIVIFESNCKHLVRCLEKAQPDLYEWKSRGVLDDILGMLRSDSSLSTQFIPRQGNKATVFLAASTNKEVCPIGWVEIPLPPLFSVLKEDMKDNRNHQTQNPSKTISMEPG